MWFVFLAKLLYHKGMTFCFLQILFTQQPIIIYKMPGFFSFEFNPGFAGLTFPMAIGIVASTKMAGLLTAQGYEFLGNIAKQISGIQIYMTTAIISFVLYNFARILVRSYKK